MGFEKRILNEIEPLLVVGNHVEFCNGTLFLENVSGETGKRIYNRLVQILGKDSFRFNIYNRIDGFAVDFV
jgi:hypothetical protein